MTTWTHRAVVLLLIPSLMLESVEAFGARPDPTTLARQYSYASEALSLKLSGASARPGYLNGFSQVFRQYSGIQLTSWAWNTRGGRFVARGALAFVFYIGSRFSQRPRTWLEAKARAQNDLEPEKFNLRHAPWLEGPIFAAFAYPAVSHFGWWTGSLVGALAITVFLHGPPPILGHWTPPRIRQSWASFWKRWTGAYAIVVISSSPLMIIQLAHRMIPENWVNLKGSMIYWIFAILDSLFLLVGGHRFWNWIFRGQPDSQLSSMENHQGNKEKEFLKAIQSVIYSNEELGSKLETELGDWEDRDARVKLWGWFLITFPTTTKKENISKQYLLGFLRSLAPKLTLEMLGPPDDAIAHPPLTTPALQFADALHEPWLDVSLYPEKEIVKRFGDSPIIFRATGDGAWMLHIEDERGNVYCRMVWNPDTPDPHSKGVLWVEGRLGKASHDLSKNPLYLLQADPPRLSKVLMPRPLVHSFEKNFGETFLSGLIPAYHFSWYIQPENDEEAPKHGTADSITGAMAAGTSSPFRRAS